MRVPDVEVFRVKIAVRGGLHEVLPTTTLQRNQPPPSFRVPALTIPTDHETV